MRNYLKSEEIAFIVNSMLAKETEIEREVLKVSLVSQLLFEDIDFSDCNDCFDVYNKIMELKQEMDFDFDRDVENYYILDRLVEKENSIYKVLENFLNDVSEKIDNVIEQVDGSKFEELINGVQEVIEIKEKEVENN